jgi:hypothetical protein
MGYATVDDFTNAFDEQTIRDLASDTGIAVESLATSTAVTSALDAGAGRIEAACFVGKMYSADDLAGLTGHSAALMYLMSRRPEKYGTDFFKAIDERIESYLKELREGARLFVTENAQDAGLPEVDGPSALVFQRLNLITQRTQRFYPSVASRLPVGRGG